MTPIHLNARKLIRPLIRPLILIVWIVACFCFFQADFKYHFYFLEQNQLFLLSGAYLTEFFNAPAWLSCMAGEYLQQFYHYPCAGAGILTISLFVLEETLYFALRRVFPEKTNAFFPMSLALLVITIEARLYIYENAQLASVISLAGASLLWLLLNLVRPYLEKQLGKWTELSFIGPFVVGGLFCYWMFGYGLLLMLLLELIYGLFRKRVPVSALASIVIAAILLVPVSKHYRLEKTEALVYPGVGKWIQYEPASKVESMLEYYHLYKCGNYKGVISKYEKTRGEKRKEQTFIYSMALSQYCMLPDKLASMKDPMIGTSIHLGRSSSYMVSLLMSELYYLIGDMTYAERAYMHVNNFSSKKRSAYVIQKLAEIELVSGDYQSAEKYINMLKKSPVYRKWAMDHDPDSMREEVKTLIEIKRRYINTQAEVRVGDNCRNMLLGILKSNRNNLVALDYLLCTDILEGRAAEYIKDYEEFGPRDKDFYRMLLTQAQNRIK